MNRLALLRDMMRIRAFETALAARPDRGFQLFSSGAEGVAVGVAAALSPQDQMLTSGRSIGPALARGLDPRLVMAELLGKATGPNRGKGGRGHLSQPSIGFFGAHAVVGGNLSIAAGVALAMQTRGQTGITVCIFGDGACASGALHETLNVAALWRLPLLLVCDNNQMAISTPPSAALAPQRLSDFAAPFGIAHATVDGADVVAVQTAAAGFAEHARTGGGPAFLECVSERFYSHSTATRETRTAAKMAEVLARCPVRRLADALVASGLLDSDTEGRMQADAQAEAARALAFADASAFPDAAEALTDVG
jgi:TPP-dependent pyruvate/acetoin dehydrogenase alpha subunit